MSLRNKKTSLLELVVAGSALVAVTALVVVPGNIVSLITGTNHKSVVSTATAPTAWWDNVGGCGVGGASGGGGGGAKWVGRGITGGLVDMQLMSSITVGGDYYYKSFSARYSSKFFNKLNVGMSLPWSIKEGTFEYDTNESKNTQMINGFGNMGFDCSYSFGETENMSVAWNLGLPTGRYDHRRADPGLMPMVGKNTVTSLVTPELQPGNGLFSTGLALDYSIDKDWGPIMFGVSYSASFLNLSDLAQLGAQNDVWEQEKHIGDIGGSSEESTYGLLHPRPVLSDAVYEISASVSDTTQYEIDAAAWIANVVPRINEKVDVAYHYYTRNEDNTRNDELHGDFFGNSIGANFAIGYKEEACVHSFGATYSYKLALDWYVRRPDPGVLATDTNTSTLVREYWISPVESGGHHSFSVAYGLEISNMDFPVFVAGAAGFTETGFSNISGSVGIKGSFF